MPLFPKLKLPAMTPDDALILASGPSLDDYERADVNACQATKYGAGEVGCEIEVDHHALIDPNPAYVSQRSILPRAKVHVTEHFAAESERMKLPEGLRSRMNVVPGLNMASAGVQAMHLASRNGHRRMFLLGMDGLSDSRGRTRLVAHADGMNRPQTTGAFGIRAAELTQAEEVFFSTEKHEIHSLSTTSILNGFLPVHPDVESQPFGRIDRHSSLMIVDAAPSNLQEAVLLVRCWRNRDARQAIAVVCDEPPTRYTAADVLFVRSPADALDCSDFSEVQLISFCGGR